MPSTMKDRCQQIAPMLAALAEDADEARADPQVAQHLAKCDPCQRSLRLQREMHGLLRARAASLQERAPDALRASLAGQLEPGPIARRLAAFRAPLAATLLLAVLGLLVYGTTSSSTVLAAQLALDHIKCVRLVPSGTSLNPVLAVREWAQRYGWTPRIPSPSPARKAALVGVRHCLYGHGHLAHLLYEVDGHTVSVFVMPRSEYPVGAAPARHDVLGQHAEVWARGDQSFAVVGDLSPQTFAFLAAELRASER